MRPNESGPTRGVRAHLPAEPVKKHLGRDFGTEHSDLAPDGQQPTMPAGVVSLFVTAAGLAHLGRYSNRAEARAASAALAREMREALA